jgi:hypothetical protein
MWQTKTFKTREAMEAFIKKGGIQWQEVFINNKPFAIEYRKLRRVY